jgi:hypothetical protein
MPITINNCSNCGKPPKISIDEDGSENYARHVISCNALQCWDFAVMSAHWEIVLDSWNALNEKEADSPQLGVGTNPKE